MATVSILGTGNMGPAIAGVIEKSGNTVQLLGSNDTEKPVTGEIVVLAVPYPAVGDVLAQRGEQLAGKVVADITNPLNFETFDSLAVPANFSATAEIQTALPVSRVVKAFNITFAATPAAGQIAFLVPRTGEFAHLHPGYDGSLHLALPPALARDAIVKGWAVAHPLAGYPSGPRNGHDLRAAEHCRARRRRRHRPH